MRHCKITGPATAFLGSLLLAVPATGVQAQAARDYISIVGSSTVYPFSTVVAEQFGRTTAFRTPRVEPLGSGGGLKAFCAGVGVQFPDIANSSRPIKASEFADCTANGAGEIIEVRIGYDGIVLANSVDVAPLALERRQIYLALAREVPNPDGSPTLVRNPYQRWSQVDPTLPDVQIEVLGPPPTSGTRDAFVELAMDAGCRTFPWLEELRATDQRRFEQLCYTLREDGRFVEAGENDNLIVQKLRTNADAIGIFGFSFLDQNSDIVQGIAIDGQLPEFEAIASGDYPVARPLYMYVKKAHVGNIPGIAEYLAEFVSPRAMGEEGYLADRGLVPLPDDDLAGMRARIRDLVAMPAPR